MLHLIKPSWLFALEDFISCKSFCREQICCETGQQSHNGDELRRKTHNTLCYWHRNWDLKAILLLFWASNIYTCVKCCVYGPVCVCVDAKGCFAGATLWAPSCTESHYS